MSSMCIHPGRLKYFPFLQPPGTMSTMVEGKESSDDVTQVIIKSPSRLKTGHYKLQMYYYRTHNNDLKSV